jgi:hypothetical protein
MKHGYRFFSKSFSIIGTLLFIACLAVNAGAAPPANDNFGSATVINGTSGQSALIQTAEATKEAGEPNHAGNPGGRSIWFRWIAPNSNNSVSFHTQNTSTNFNTTLAAYTGISVNLLTPVVSNNDFGNQTRSRVTFLATANTIYYIAIDGFDAASGSARLSWTLNTLPADGVDFDGMLGQDVVAVFRPSTGTWYTSNLLGAPTIGQQWGANGDIPVPADYDGDDRTDFAVYRSGAWYILQSATGTLNAQFWGVGGDRPVPGDYFGDGRADVAVFRPSNGTWYLRDPFQGTEVFQAWGQTGDTPVQRDYDGDGRTDIAVYRPATGGWYLIHSRTGAHVSRFWGSGGDIPVPADYSVFADGRSDIAIFRPSDGSWWIVESSFGAVVPRYWGGSGDIPQPSRVAGNTGAAMVVYRPSNRTWYVNEFGSFMAAQQWGAPGDIPVGTAFIVEP